MNRGELRKYEEIEAAFSSLRKDFVGDIKEAKAKLGDRLITSVHYKDKLGLAVEPEGSLPANILEILERDCPVHKNGKKVKETHILACIPEDITLAKLSSAVGGQAGKVLYSDWFLNQP